MTARRNSSRIIVAISVMFLCLNFAGESETAV